MLIQRKFNIEACEPTIENVNKCYFVVQDHVPIGPPFEKFEDIQVVVAWLNIVASELDSNGYDQWQNLHRNN